LDNRIQVSKDEIQNILDEIKDKNKKYFLFWPRDMDTQKDPKSYMAEIGIDYDDAIKEIKELTIDNYVECILDTVHNYKYLYIFKKIINDSNTYIKIGFLYDMKKGNVYVVSFHEDMD